MEKTKLIVIGAAKKISPEMMSRLREHYKCDIEIVSPDEYKASLKKEEIERVYIMQNYELPKIPPMEVLKSLVKKKESSKPYNPRKIGEIDSKKKSLIQRYNNKKLRTR